MTNLPFRLTTPPTAAALTRRQIGAKRAQRAGSNFQKAIVFSAGIHKDLIEIEELPGFGARKVSGGRVVYEKMPCDFMGCFLGGMALHFDAKSCGAETVSFNVKTMILGKEHQLIHLRKMRAKGALAGYLVECGWRQEYLWLDVKFVVDDGPIRFEREGTLCRQWLPLGPVTLAVDFKKLREVYIGGSGNNA